MRNLDIIFCFLLVGLLGTLSWWWSQRYEGEAEALETRLKSRISDYENTVLISTIKELSFLRKDTTKGQSTEEGIKFPVDPKWESKRGLKVVSFSVDSSLNKQNLPKMDTNIHLRYTPLRVRTDSNVFPLPPRTEDGTKRLVINAMQTESQNDWDSVVNVFAEDLSLSLRVVPPSGSNLRASDTASTWYLPLDDESVSFGINDQPFNIGSNNYVILSNYRRVLLSKMAMELILGILLLLGLAFFYFLVKRDINRRELALSEKDRFIANVAHELKTPIATVGVALEALDQFGADADPERRKQYLKMSRNELNRLESLAERALGTIQLESQSFQKQLRPVDVKEVAEASWRTLLMKHQLSDAQLTWQIKHADGQVKDLNPESIEDFVVPGQAELLRHLFDNLLDNAIKYGGTPPDIRLVLGPKRAQSLTFSVIDNGPGIPSEEKEKVFDKFYRIERAGEGHAIKGHGLGLAYVREIVRTHGGEISVSSSEAGGASFDVVLPR